MSDVGYCDRHLIHEGRYVEAEHEVRVGMNKWTLCSECKQALHHWFGNYLTNSDRVVRSKEESDEVVRERMEQL